MSPLSIGAEKFVIQTANGLSANPVTPQSNGVARVNINQRSHFWRPASGEAEGRCFCTSAINC